MSANIEAVRQAYEAFKRLDPDGLIAIADPEIEFGTSAAAPGGTYRGYTGIRRYLKEIEAAFGDSWEAEVERIADAGDEQVILIARVYGVGKAGEPLEIRLGHVWKLRGGKLLSGTVYLDPEAALRAVDSAATS